MLFVEALLMRFAGLCILCRHVFALLRRGKLVHMIVSAELENGVSHSEFACSPQVWGFLNICRIRSWSQTGEHLVMQFDRLFSKALDRPELRVSCHAV